MSGFALLSIETPSPAPIDTIISATDTVASMVSSVFGAITGNPLLSVFAAAGLLVVGIGVFSRLKRVAR